MHNNYYFLKHLSKELEHKVVGSILLEAFSQNKDELILGFNLSNHSFFINAHLLADFSCLYFSEDFHRSKRNSVNLFKPITGRTVIGIKQFLNERCFSIDFEDDFQLIFKLHGNRANIVLTENGQAISLFKNNLSNDFNIKPNELDRPLSHTMQALENAAFDYKILFPTFGKPVKDYLEEHNYQSITVQEKWALIQRVVTQLNKKEFHVLKKDEVYSLSLFDNKNTDYKTNSAIEAVNFFYLNYIRSSQLQKEKKQITTALERKIKQSKNYISKVSDKLDSIINNTNYEILANIIMANLNTIEKHSKDVVLTNFYDNSEISIKLNPKLSPQKNAEGYYRKSKNQKIEIQKLKDTLKSKIEGVKLIANQLSKISSIGTTSELRKYLKENALDVKSQTSKKISLPYHDLTIDGYSVWIGKNAKNNDIVTQKLAWKEDLWLHAKDVSGSHVIIKHQAGKTFPKHVIEKAAQWAAFYSKRRNESLCPVIVTPKKFVRKPKGLPAGAVVVDKENVVLVSPENPTIQ